MLTCNEYKIQYLPIKRIQHVEELLEIPRIVYLPQRHLNFHAVHEIEHLVHAINHYSRLRGCGKIRYQAL